mgnify:FL=1
MKAQSVKQILLGLIVPVLILAAWICATHFRSIPTSILPKISMVWQAFLEMLQSGQLWKDLSVTLSRVMKGYLLSALLGMILGSLMSMSKTVAYLLQPTVTVIRQIPIIAWIPLIILWCGIGELSKIVVIVMAAFFPIMMNTMSGISSTPAGYIEVAQLYKLSFFKTFRKVYLPQILVGLKLGLGISWIAVVAAELIASLSGIGYRMSNARSLMQSDVVIVCMILIGLIGILMDKILGVIFTAITPWNKKQK